MSRKKQPDVFARHSINIARQTLKMPDAILGVMGGMTKEQARKTLQEHGLQEEAEEAKEEEGQEDHTD